jgi:hypothetical protein
MIERIDSSQQTNAAVNNLTLDVQDFLRYNSLIVTKPSSIMSCLPIRNDSRNHL